MHVFFWRYKSTQKYEKVVKLSGLPATEIRNYDGLQPPELGSWKVGCAATSCWAGPTGVSPCAAGDPLLPGAGGPLLGEKCTASTFKLNLLGCFVVFCGNAERHAKEEQPRPRAVVFGSLRAARRRSFGGTAMLGNPSGIKAALDLL